MIKKIYEFRKKADFVGSAEIFSKKVKKRYGKKVYTNTEYDFSEVNTAVLELLYFLKENNLKWQFMMNFTNKYVRSRVDDFMMYHSKEHEEIKEIYHSNLTQYEEVEREEWKSEFFEDEGRREVIPEFEVKESEMEKWS